MNQNLQKCGPTKPSSFKFGHLRYSGVVLEQWLAQRPREVGLKAWNPQSKHHGRQSTSLVCGASLKWWWPYVLWCLFSLHSPSPRITSFWGAWEGGKRFAFLPVHSSGSVLSSAFSILTLRPSQLWRTASDPKSKQLLCTSIRSISVHISFLPNWVIWVSLSMVTLLSHCPFGAMPMRTWNLHRWYRKCVGTETHSRNSSLHILYGRGW